MPLQSGWTVLVVLLPGRSGEYSISEAEAYVGRTAAIPGQSGIHFEPQRACLPILHDILDDAIPGWESRIFEKNINDDGYHEVVQSGHIPLGEEEVDTICAW